MPAAIKMMPQSRSSTWGSMAVDKNEKIMAAMQPLIMTGRAERIFKAPCFHRKTLEITAAGMKNSNTIPRAVKESIFKTKVNHRISRLPPPMPRPVKKPRMVAIKRFMATSIESLPR